MAKENTQANVSQALLGANDKGKVTYQVNGEDVNLSFQIVRNFLTRGGADVSDAEVIQFIFLCKANQLNPFIGDAYMVKFKARDGQRQEAAQMIISKAAFMKRAEASPLFKGYQAGVIILRDKRIVEEEGSFFLPGDQLLGGWAKVYRADRDCPTVARVRLEEYNKNKSTWAAMPGTMIRKVAIAQAFREAFPLAVEGMYVPEEVPEEQEQPSPEANKAVPQFRDEEPAPQPDPEPEFTPDPEPEFTPDPEPQEEEPVIVDAPAADENESLFRL